MNNGPTPSLSKYFPPNEVWDIKPIERPIIYNQEIKDPAPHTKCGVTDHRPVRGADPHWLAGFENGDGWFEVVTRNSKTAKFGTQVILRFSVGQHSRDIELIKSIVK